MNKPKVFTKVRLKRMRKRLRKLEKTQKEALPIINGILHLFLELAESIEERGKEQAANKTSLTK